MNNDQEFLAIYEVYNMTGDKMDFAENILLLYKKAFGTILKDVLTKQSKLTQEKSGLLREQLLKVDKVLRMEEALDLLQSAYEVFEILKDEHDFYGSIKHILQKYQPDLLPSLLWYDVFMSKLIN